MRKVLYGVFLVDGRWKLYSETERTRQFPDRDQAIQAGLAVARMALQRGVDAELHVQDVTGALQRYDIRERPQATPLEEDPHGRRSTPAHPFIEGRGS